MKINQSILLSIATLLLLLSHFIQAAEETDGSCEGFKFLLQSNSKSINTSWPLYVLRNNAPVYSYANGNRKKTTLKFGEVLNALKFVNLAVCQMKL